MKNDDNLSDETKNKLERELEQAEHSINELGQSLVNEDLLKKAPLSLSESIRQKIAEKQREQS